MNALVGSPARASRAPGHDEHAQVGVRTTFDRDRSTSSDVRRWQTDSTLAVLVLSATSSLLGLLRPGFYTDPVALLARTRAEDLVFVAVAVPALATGLGYARRVSVRGRIVWLGALAYTTFVPASRLVSRSFDSAFPGYVALVTLSLFTLVGGLLDTDADAVRRRLDGRLRERLYAGVFAVVGAALAALWLSDVVPASLAGTPPAIVGGFWPRGLGTVAIDLSLVVPSLAVSAAWLWRGRAWGYVAAGYRSSSARSWHRPWPRSRRSTSCATWP